MKKLLELVSKKEEPQQNPPPRPPPPVTPSAPPAPGASAAATMPDTNLDAIASAMATIQATLTAHVNNADARMEALEKTVKALMKDKTQPDPEAIEVVADDDKSKDDGKSKDALAITRSGYQADTDSREASPSPSKRSSKRRPRSRSRGRSRASSKASSREASQERERRRDQKRIPTAVGIERLFKPVGAGASMALGAQGEFNQEEKERARLDINKRLTRPRIDAYLQEEKLEKAKRVEKRRTIVPPVELHPQHKRFPTMDAPDVDKIRKALKKSYGTFGMKDDKSLSYFLNKFVNTVNSNMLGEAEAGDLLSEFFSGDLQRIVLTHLRISGLEKTIRLLRFFKSDGSTILDQRDEITKWKLKKSATDSVKDQLLSLYSMFVSAYPDYPEDMVLAMFKGKVSHYLPEDNDINEQDEDHFETYGSHMDVMQYSKSVEKVLKYGKSSSKKTHDVFAVKKTSSQPSTSTPPTSSNGPDKSDELKKIYAHLNRIDQKMDHNKSYAMVAGQTPPPPQANGQRGGQNIFYRADDPGYAGVVQQFVKKRDLNAELPDTKAEEVPFQRLADGKIEPLHHVPMAQFPNTGIVMFSHKANRHYITKKTQEHFRSRCATCGIPGHGSSSSGCPMRESTDSWALCPRCRLGFHLNCPYSGRFLKALQVTGKVNC